MEWMRDQNHSGSVLVVGGVKKEMKEITSLATSPELHSSYYEWHFNTVHLVFGPEKLPFVLFTIQSNRHISWNQWGKGSYIHFSQHKYLFLHIVYMLKALILDLLFHNCYLTRMAKKWHCIWNQFYTVSELNLWWTMSQSSYAIPH